MEKGHGGLRMVAAPIPGKHRYYLENGQAATAFRVTITSELHVARKILDPLERGELAYWFLVTSDDGDFVAMADPPRRDLST